LHVRNVEQEIGTLRRADLVEGEARARLALHRFHCGHGEDAVVGVLFAEARRIDEILAVHGREDFRDQRLA
jgi:hypothetical protein